MRGLHDAFAWFVVVANGLVGGWALAAHRWSAWRMPALWWCTVVAQVAIFVEVAFGVAIVAIDDIDPPQFHMFYGFVALATVGIVYSYLRTYRRQLEPYRYLIYGLGGLFLMGLAIRAMVIPA
jgi:hypothetical protein